MILSGDSERIFIFVVYANEEGDIGTITMTLNNETNDYFYTSPW